MRQRLIAPEVWSLAVQLWRRCKAMVMEV